VVPSAPACPNDGSFIFDHFLPFQCSTNTPSRSVEVATPVFADTQSVAEMQLVEPNV
jgi:hypothetical protein